MHFYLLVTRPSASELRLACNKTDFFQLLFFPCSNISRMWSEVLVQ